MFHGAWSWSGREELHSRWWCDYLQYLHCVILVTSLKVWDFCTVAVMNRCSINNVFVGLPAGLMGDPKLGIGWAMGLLGNLSSLLLLQLLAHSCGWTGSVEGELVELPSMSWICAPHPCSPRACAAGSCLPQLGSGPGSGTGCLLLWSAVVEEIKRRHLWEGEPPTSD